MWKRHLTVAYKTGRKIIVAIVGITVVLFGMVLFFTPGPAVLVIPAGLAILGAEFAWARRWLVQLRKHASTVVSKINNQKAANRAQAVDTENNS